MLSPPRLRLRIPRCHTCTGRKWGLTKILSNCPETRGEGSRASVAKQPPFESLIWAPKQPKRKSDQSILKRGGLELCRGVFLTQLHLSPPLPLPAAPPIPPLANLPNPNFFSRLLPQRTCKCLNLCETARRGRKKASFVSEA